MNHTIKTIVIIFLIGFLSACDPAGTTEQRISGSETALPEELKGLKVYAVADGNGGDIKVAILNNKPNSLTYSQGKTTATTLLIDPSGEQDRVITVAEIISENDTMIIARKAR